MEVLICVLFIGLLVALFFITEDDKKNKNELISEIHSEKAVYYSKESYKCKVGEVLETTITATSNLEKDQIPSISSYTSSDESIAIIEKHPTMKLRCISCEAVQITCISPGTVTLKAESTLGVTGFAQLTVEE